MTYDITRIRNFGIVAHVDAGKTTLSERILLYTGRIRRLGEVHEGQATLDHRAAEKEKGITITAATVRCRWKDHDLHLVDTPGHVDFTVEVARSLRVLDGVVVVLDGVAGVEPQTENVWAQADRHALPRLLFVNKLDRPGARFERACREAEATFGVPVLPLALPLPEAGGEGVAGLVDVVEERALVWRDAEGSELAIEPVPGALREATRAARERLAEAVADVDEVFLEAWLEGDVSPDLFRRAIRRATLLRRIVPALGGSAYRNRGVQPLLDAVVAYLPSPEDRGAIVSLDGATRRPPTDAAPLAALAFKVVHDRYGALTFVRVYAGVLREGQRVWCSREGRELRVGRLVRLFADRREPLEAARAGEIAGLVGGELRTGDTLADPAHPLTLEALAELEPAVERAIRPAKAKDGDALGKALRRLLVEDPSLRVREDAETGELLLAGMGELHLEIAARHLEEDHAVRVSLGRPKVAYRETVQRSVEHEVKLKKQTGGPGQYAHVVVRLGPAASGAGLLFENRTTQGVIPKELVPAIEKGLREGMASGPLGFPLVDLEVALLGGSFHPNDSHDRDFQRVAATAVAEACREAGPVLLEPWVDLEVSVPSDALGDLLGDLARRRARVVGMEAEGERTRVAAEAPLAELFGYAGELAGLSHGRGQHAHRPRAYEPVPEALVAAALRAA
ncbi:MAG TPA: elongation factor G [Polyangiaceae bacterium LLY-WYZ-15_(1-7)]|nr:elongation factor G [Polyangiaceae bacterium LLY-WYZ-15_(1-7)]HJL11437.1 elongation factor G [Polyangiaceae bacterium LLY-WYZ-15_(1-7)]HJL35454.1 elongation factor G [Polyangiaceae bacterium LLY-WYZ-15_(1-7)]